MSMRTIDPKTTPQRDVFQMLIGGVSPRPIALVATLSAEGVRNLAPFSFFNAFGGNPPMIAFSAARSAKTGLFKDTYHNLVATKECTVQAVTHAMVEKVNLASAMVPPDVDEFELSGLSAVDSELISAPRVAESPFQMECVLKEMIHLGDGGGSGNLAICEVLRFHVSEEVLDESGKIDPRKLDLVGRNGGNFYTRAAGDALFELAGPTEEQVKAAGHGVA